MKRFAILMISLCFAVSACSSGQTYLGNQGCEKTKTCLSSIPTASPSKSKPATKTTKAPVATSSSAAPKGPVTTFHIKIRNVANGYEPNSLRAYVGDIVIFENLDTATAAGHSWTGDNNEWNSGIIKPGKTWQWVIDIAPKVYQGWHDESVPYLVGGPFEVLARK